MFPEHSEEIYLKLLERDNNIELAEELIESNNYHYMRLMVKNVQGVPVGLLLSHIGSESFAHEALDYWIENGDNAKVFIYGRHIKMYSIPALIDDDNIYLAHFTKRQSVKKLEFK